MNTLLLNIKKIIVVGTLTLGIFFVPKNVEAYVPDVNVRVINSVTNAPVTGVWVRQKNTGQGTNPGWSSFLNNCDGSESTKAISGRYSQTNANGTAVFGDPEAINQSTCNQPIDTNKDGTNDQVSFPCTTGVSKSDGTTSCVAFGEFSCYGNPMTFEVVKPAGDNGTYTSLSGVVVPNAAADLELTLYYTPAGSTPGPTPTSNPITEATKKEIGVIASFGSKFQPLTELEEGQDYWIRIQVFNGGRGYSRIRLHEVINSTYFQLYQPGYESSNYLAGNFFIESPVYSGISYKMEDTTNTECPDPGTGLASCISGYTTGGNRAIAQPTDALNATSFPQKYFYFKVKAIKNSNGLPVKVDVDDTYPAHTGSYVDYIDKPDSQVNEPGLDNEEVIICPVGGCPVTATDGYFQVSKGDTYSNAPGTESIKSILPSGTNFSPDNSSIVMHTGSAANFGQGGTNPNNWYLKGYSIDDTLSYDTLYSDYSAKIVNKNITGINSFTTTGYYVDTSTQASAIKRYTISGSNWQTTLSGKQVVYFVPGDLYIDVNTDVATTNGSSIIYVVAGNVGISPSVTKFEGIIIADGAIDTACDSNILFTGTTCGSGSQSLTNALTLEGVFYAKGGFVLDRKATSGASESFIGRPDFLLSTIATFGKNVYSWKEYAN